MVRESADAARNWQAGATIKRGIATWLGERGKPAPVSPQSRLAAHGIFPALSSLPSPDPPAAFLDSGRGHRAFGRFVSGEGRLALTGIATELS